MTGIEIRSVVPRGDHAGEVQEPHPVKNGLFVMGSSRFKEDEIPEGDLKSVADALRAGLRLRMNSPNVLRSMRKPGEVAMNEMTVEDHFSRRGDRS